MTIDEAIAHTRDVANKQKIRSDICIQNDSECDKFSDCLKCAEEHEQLAEWLEELKFRRVLQLQCEKEFFAGYEKGKKEGYNKGYADGSLSVTSEIRNKVIDDLLEDANEMAIEVDTGTYTMKAIRIGLLGKIAEKLKEGGKNEQY